MATPQRPLSRGKRNLRCIMCRDIYRRPKLLPCLHTLCLHCVETQVAEHGPQSFPCPQCGKTVQVPPGGAYDFDDNEYIAEEDLQRERNLMSAGACPVHRGEPLKFVCVSAQCDKAICLSCKLTKHMEHGCVDIAEAAAKCRVKLAQERERLESSINSLKKLAGLANDNLGAARRKAKILKEQVNAQHHAMVVKVTELRDTVLAGLEDVTLSIDQELSQDAEKTREVVDRLLQLQRRVDDAVDGTLIDAEMVAVETEVRKGQGSAVELAKLEARKPWRTPRPGLQSYARSFGESLEKDILLYLGSPVRLLVPNKEPSELIVAFYRCGKEEEDNREVHAVCRTNDGTLHVAYGGMAPSFADARVARVDQSGTTIDDVNTGRKVRFEKSGRVDAVAPPPADGWEEILATSNCDFRVRARLFQQARILIEGNTPPDVINARPVHFEVNDTYRPRGFDVSSNGELFVLISEEEADDVLYTKGKGPTRNLVHRPRDVLCAQVHLYRKNLSDAVASYTSPLSHFFPTAVTFWTVGQQEFLLIADLLNDCVHVVQVVNGEFKFDRFLQSAGCGDLVRPTALDVDSDGSVWIGCETGWVLRCQSVAVGTLPHAGDPQCHDEVDTEVLKVQNPSRKSTQSGSVS